MSTNELSSKVRELKSLKTMLTELEAEIADIEFSIKEEMRARDVDTITVDMFTVRWTKIKSNRFDTTAFKKAMPDLADRFTKSVETRRFSIA